MDAFVYFHHNMPDRSTSCLIRVGSKEQILANLANFAYDPINYGYLRQLNVIDLFIGNDLKYILVLYFISYLIRCKIITACTW